ncbi:MAG: type II toxin-antitoxin system VapC family toxin [Deltaproteobacteria bacterium]|nr:type II toxin-antitoxin system VapC family toxin [Deltaproteobacteria bacterium]
MSYLLDTNICIGLLKGEDKPLAKKIQEMSPSDFFLCSVVKGELFYGARKSQRVEENMKLLAGFFSQFDSLPFDDRAAEFYGTLRAILVKAGTPVGANDMLIAGIAMSHDLTLVSRNRREFQFIPGLRLEGW